MKHFLYYIFFLVVIVSCKKNGEINPEKPENLLSEKQMVDVLYEMALVTSSKSTNRSILEKNNVDPEGFIYKKHNIDSLQFAESNMYYSHDLDIYESIYQKVKSRLDKDKELYQDEVDQERKQSDSLREARRNNKDSLNRTKSKITGGELKRPTPVPLKSIDTSKILKRQ